mgnify:CR=1 FL=1
MSTKMNEYEQDFVAEENEDKHLDIWDVLPPRLQKREGEDKKINSGLQNTNPPKE